MVEQFELRLALVEFFVITLQEIVCLHCKEKKRKEKKALKIDKKYRHFSINV